MNDHLNQVSQCIDGDMAFSTFDFLASVKASLLTGRDGFDALRVYDRVARRRRLIVFFRYAMFNSSSAASQTPRRFQLL